MSFFMTGFFYFSERMTVINSAETIIRDKARTAKCHLSSSMPNFDNNGQIISQIVAS